MVRRRIAVSLAVAAVLAATVAFSTGGAGATAPRAASKGTSPGITFSAPFVVDTVHTYGEPDLRVDPSTNARQYVSGPWGTGTQRSIWNFSEDGGRTYHPIHDTALTSADGSDTRHVGPGGGDTEISVSHSGKVYYSDLAALVTLKTAVWDPTANPRTLTTGFYGNSDQGANGVDRQWFGLWDPPADQVAAIRSATGYKGPLPVNYLVYAEALLGCCEAASYSTNGIDYTGPTEEFSINSDGPVVVDQKTGTVLEAVGLGSPNAVGVAILTRDAGQPNSPAIANSQVKRVANLPAGTDVGALFPTIAIDSARNAYLVWVTRDDDHTVAQSASSWQIFYSYAKASTGWQTWSAPRQLSKPPSLTNIMPWSVAGSGGRLAAVWYGTNDGTHNPSSEDNHQAWDVYLSLVTNATSSNPDIRQTKVTPHPMHYGTICLAGTGCIASQGNRNLADFFEVYVDNTGAIEIAYDDTSNEFVQHVPQGPGIPPPIDGAADHRGAPVVTMIRQNSGPGLFGTDVKGLRSGGDSLSDPKGDAHFDPIYNTTTSIKQLDLLGFDVRVDPDHPDTMVVRIPVNDLHNLAAAVTATGGDTVNYVARWSGAPIPDATTGTKIPIYYASVEVGSSGTPTFFAGTAISYELCSVSGCFPHVIDYPGPGNGGTAVPGKVTFIQPDKGQGNWFIIRVPRSLVGNPAVGSRLDSMGVYTYARSRSATQPITNAEAQGGILPIAIDGVCCINTILRETAH
ncbi:MAG TPA: hypothetical protein VGB19_17095 [Actinomycetota bacterium]